MLIYHKTEHRQIHVHQFNPERAAENEAVFNRRISELRRELADGERVREHEKFYERFFTVMETPKRGIRTCKNAAMAEAKS